MPTSNSVKDTLQARLIERAQVSAKEEVFSITGSLLDDAFNEHQPSAEGDYTALPVEEYELVLLLAWERVCQSRASFWATQASASGSSPNGFGSDRDTPFTKNTKLALALHERYLVLSDAIKNNSEDADAEDASGTIKVGDLYRIEDQSGIRVPTRAAPPMRKPKLYVKSSGTGFVILGWDRIDSDAFDELFIFQSAQEGINEEWNSDGNSGIPFVSAAAINIYATTDNIAKAVKVIGLTSAATYYFCAVARDTNGLPVFSNEVSAVVP